MSQFAILVPGDHPARPGPRPILHMSELSDAQLGSFCHPEGGPLFIDLETQGTEVWNHERLVVGVALADAGGACYLHIGIDPNGQAAWGRLLQMLYLERTPLVAFNVQFDASWMSRDLARAAQAVDYKPYVANLDVPVPWHNWYACAFAAYKHFASEGWVGQRHGLKQAMQDMLGWEDSNDAELSGWLCDHGYGAWENEKQDDGSVLRVARPDKGEMWRAPPEVLGKYAAEDAESTYLLWDRVLKPAWDVFDAYREYHQQWLCGDHGLQRHLVWQKLRGVSVDVPRLQTIHDALEVRIAELENEFRLHPVVAPHIQAFEDGVLQVVVEQEPARWKKLPVLAAEPEPRTKSGAVSKSWEKWKARSEDIAELMLDIQLAEAGACVTLAAGSQESSHWRGWKARVEKARTTRHFNLRSGEQKRVLFYDKLGHPVLLMTDNENNPQPAIDEDALKGFGEPGALLIRHGGLEKLRSSVVSLQERCAVGVGGRYHPELRTPGTATGRLSGSGGYNWQNAPKCKELLECMQADPGHVLLACDVASLEQVVLCQLSRDPALMKIYGPSAKKNDIYLFNGANLGGSVGAAIRAAGYDPDNPTPEGIASAKKLAKKERSIAKVYTLAASYGAGPGKIRATLGTDGVEISLGEAKRMHAAYWALYAGVRTYARWLEAQWERNGGWVLNGIGRPVAVAEDFKRDLVNRVVQSTGHDVFMLFTVILAEELARAGILCKPFNHDLHDACYFLVPEKDTEAARHIVDVVVVERVAQILGGSVKMKWDAAACRTVADDKTEAASLLAEGVKL